MKSNKKTLLISWFIGIGFGLFLSGIILSILLYTSDKANPIPIERPDQVEQSENNTDFKDPELAKITKDITKIEEAKQENEEVDNLKTESQTIELEIETAATAHDITRILVENHVISDYDGFINHIVLHDAERSLSHGTMTFPLNSDIETVFKILRP